MDTIMIVLLVAILLAAAAAWYFLRERKSRSLRQRFGPEYESTVRQYGDRAKAESDLERRMKRVERFRITPLAENDRQWFAERWRESQARFVDDPGGAVTEADRLVVEVMRARGYPMSEFENRALDLSVDYPHVVENYRAAHELADRHAHGQADTEDLRRGFVYYRQLFDELLEPESNRQELHR